jgi:molybdate transport system substrate-binding protein
VVRLPLRALAVVLTSALSVMSVRPITAQPGILIFAASSLSTALDGLTPAILEATGVSVRASYAASSALARQIEQGAPADLFISADVDWMDYVQERGLVQSSTRINLLGNTLVLVRPAGPPDARVRALRIAPRFPLAAALGIDRLALADPSTVPAGKYARAALTTLGVWEAVEAKLAPAENVRAALVLVSRGEAPLGIVYRSDAIADPRVAIIDVFPAATHPAIVYPAALTTQGSSQAGRVLAFLQSARAAAVFESLGFGVLQSSRP